jgi:integrase/recombinase XerD
MLFREAFEPFMTFCRAERLVAPETELKYRDCFRSWLLPVLGSISLTDFSQAHVLKLRSDMLSRQLSVARMYSVLMCLKAFLKFCHSHLQIQAMDPTAIALPKRGTPQVEYLTNAEVQRVLDAIDVYTYAGARLRALVELLLSTGMRISEALALNRQVFDVGANETEIVGKGKRRRLIFLAERCRYWVKRYLDKRVDDHEALFVTTGLPARRQKREDMSRFFRFLKAKAGINKKLTPHILRHTFCTNLLFGGADITHIRDLAGHQDIQTTARYYLGKNKEKLREILNHCLDYGLDKNDPMRGTFGQNRIDEPLATSTALT